MAVYSSSCRTPKRVLFSLEGMVNIMLQDHALDKTTPVPLYYQLKSLLLQEIRSGNYPPGSMIPTELEISNMFEISRSTVQKAIIELVSEGYLYRVKSKGTFVAKPKIEQHLLSSLYRYHNEIERSGYKANIELLDRKIVDMPDVLIREKAGKPGDKAVYLYRRWLTDQGELLERVISYLPYNRFGFLMEKELNGVFLHDLLDQNPETKIHRVVRCLEAVPASEDDVRYLDVHKNSAIQKLTTSRYDKSGNILDVSYAYYPGEKNLIKFEIVMPD